MLYIKILLLTILTTLCTSCTPALAYTIQGTVSYVYDGDTLILQEPLPLPGSRGLIQAHKIRLASIDASEKDQPYGTKAAQLLRSIIQNKTVLASVIDTDKYGRKIAYSALAVAQPKKTPFAEVSSVKQKVC